MIWASDKLTVYCLPFLHFKNYKNFIAVFGVFVVISKSITKSTALNGVLCLYAVSAINFFLGVRGFSFPGGIPVMGC